MKTHTSNPTWQAFKQHKRGWFALRVLAVLFAAALLALRRRPAFVAALAPHYPELAAWLKLSRWQRFCARWQDWLIESEHPAHRQWHALLASLQSALQRLAQEPDGIIVVLDEAQNNNDILSRMVAFTHNNPPPKRPQEQDLRTYGIGAQILIDQGVGKMRLLSAPYKLTGISGYQLEVSEYLSE